MERLVDSMLIVATKVRGDLPERILRILKEEADDLEVAFEVVAERACRCSNLKR